VERRRNGEGEQERKIQARIYEIGMVGGYGTSRYVWKDLGTYGMNIHMR
jgi:hypothetical protein